MDRAKDSKAGLEARPQGRASKDGPITWAREGQYPAWLGQAGQDRGRGRGRGQEGFLARVGLDPR